MIAEDIKPFIPTLSKSVLTTDFPQYTLQICQDIIAYRADNVSEEAIAFYNGDHWQNSKAWIGPKISFKDKRFQETMQAIEKTFISHNAIAEVVDRHVSGVLSRELHWSFTPKAGIPPVKDKNPITGQEIEVPGDPKPAENALITEAQDALVEWWNSKNVLETLKRALAGLLLGKRSTLRISIPPGLRDEQGNIPATDLAGALDLIYLDHMGFDEDFMQQVTPTATVFISKTTRRPVGVFTYREIDEDRAEVTYVDKEGNTVLRIMNGKGDLGQPVLMPLGKRILMYEMSRKPFISPQIMSQQKSLNKTLSMMDRNGTQAGYLERYLLNVKLPEREVTDPETGEVTTETDTMYAGPGTINSLQGSEYVDEQGITRVLEPKVQFRDPVEPSTFIDGGEYTYLNILQEVNQLHYAAKDLAVSGESRRQSRDSYTKDLQSSGNIVEGTARWVLETVLALAAFLAGRKGEFEEIRAFVQATIDPGPVAPDDIRVAAEMIDRGVWDWEYGVARTGADDVDAMKKRLDKERAERDAREAALIENMPTPPEEEPETEEA